MATNNSENVHREQGVLQNPRKTRIFCHRYKTDLDKVYRESARIAQLWPDG